MANSKTKVAILMGGPSSEHEVSLNTGKNILMNLNTDKYEGVPVVISRDSEWDIPLEELRSIIDVAFIAMHGDYGEDGKVQHELEQHAIPYTGSDSHASALSMNKFLSLRLLKDFGFSIPHSLHISKKEWVDPNTDDIEKITSRIPGPWVVKPNRGGSSVDIFFPETEEKLGDALSQLFESYKDVLIQEKIEGREFTCGVLDAGAPNSSYPLVPTEIVPNLNHFFDYDSKYTEGGADEITPARLPDSWLEHLRQIAKNVHDILGCGGMSRTDMMLSKDGTVYILEVNTIPGMTKTSLLPQGADSMGISFEEMLHRIIQSGLRRHSS